MLFSSLTFILFFLPLFFIVYYVVRKREYRNFVLFLFSLLFYAWGEPVYVLLMLFSLTVNYFIALAIEKNRDKGRLWLTAAVIINLLLIGVFKYAAFLAGIVNLIPAVSLPVPEITLPIGISFYTFQILSYVIDVYRKDTSAQHNYITLGAYLCAFPQLIAGPIVRYVTVENDLMTRTGNIEDITSGVRRFILGLSKKVLIANNVAKVVDSILEHNADSIGTLGAWIVVVGYAIQIYYDFSGYSDMAIGLGKMMGFHYLENFNYPYFADSITEFWRRWHISLSSFFRDYVYIPLGGNRVSKLRWVFNLLVVWMLTGLWHGAGWNFVIWGLYYGVLLIIEKLFTGKLLAKLPVLNRFLTLCLVLGGWIVFRIEDMSYMKQFICSMFGSNGSSEFSLLQTCGVGPVFLISLAAGILFAFPIVPAIKKKAGDSAVCGIIGDIIGVTGLVLCLVFLAIGAYNPFIYFRF